MSLIRNINLNDGNGNKLTSELGALNVTLADTNFNIVNRKVSMDTGVSTTLAVDSNPGDTSITISSAVFSIGDKLDIFDGTRENVFPTVTAVSGTTITLDKPLDYGYTAGDTVKGVETSMNVVGSLVSPKSFRITPLAGEEFDLLRLLIVMTHTSSGDNGLFGDLTELTNGVILRRYDGTTGTYQSLTSWKTSGDMAGDMYDISYVARSGGGGSYGTNGRGTFSKTGAIVRVNGDVGDFVEILIQDDLSGLNLFEIKFQGHMTN